MKNFFLSPGPGYMILLGTIASLSLAGCSQQPRSHLKRTDISAQITQGGKPLTGALIDFASHENGEAYGGTLDEQGRVDLKGVAVGQYVITIQPPPGDPLPGSPRQIPKNVQAIPRSFRIPNTSPLIASVSDSESAFTYDLKDFDLSKKR